jgi:DNA polymerase-4
MSGADPRAILHVDMDAFYASVEQFDRPELRGKPLIVGGTSGRGVVAAASYEVRRHGVRSAMPIRRALALCPQAICVRPRMARYKEVSRQVFEIFHEFTPMVQGLSLDEAYLDVTASRRLLGDAVSIAREIKRRIRERTGLTASVGVGPNKLVAKIASDLDKPDGLTVVTPEIVNAVLDPLPVSRLPGLGRKKGQQVVTAGIATLGALRLAPDERLWPLFGRDTVRIRARAAGIDDRPVIADWEEKSISAEETFDTDISDPARLEAELLALCDRMTARLRTKGLVGRCVTVKIREHDFATCTRQRRFTPASCESAVFAPLARALLARWLHQHPGAKLRLLGIGASELSPAGGSAGSQAELFAPTPAGAATGVPREPALDSVLDRIRERFGHLAVTRGSRLQATQAARAGQPWRR